MFSYLVCCSIEHVNATFRQGTNVITGVDAERRANGWAILKTALAVFCQLPLGDHSSGLTKRDVHCQPLEERSIKIRLVTARRATTKEIRSTRRTND